MRRCRCEPAQVVDTEQKGQCTVSNVDKSAARGSRQGGGRGSAGDPYGCRGEAEGWPCLAGLDDSLAWKGDRGRELRLRGRCAKGVERHARLLFQGEGEVRWPKDKCSNEGRPALREGCCWWCDCKGASRGSVGLSGQGTLAGWSCWATSRHKGRSPRACCCMGVEAVSCYASTRVGWSGGSRVGVVCLAVLGADGTHCGSVSLRAHTACAADFGGWSGGSRLYAIRQGYDSSGTTSTSWFGMVLALGGGQLICILVT